MEEDEGQERGRVLRRNHDPILMKGVTVLFRRIPIREGGLVLTSTGGVPGVPSPASGLTCIVTPAVVQNDAEMEGRVTV